MHTISKHIRRAAARQLVAVMAQILQVAGQSRIVAADVNDTLRSHLYHGRKDALLAALARRVKNNSIILFTGTAKLRHNLLRISGKTARVFRAV